MKDLITSKKLIETSSKQIYRDFLGIKESYKDAGEAGFETESILKKYLNKYLPTRFRAVSGYIIDENDNISPQLDIIIYDAQNSFPLRVDEKNYYISNENVACVIETTYRLDKQKLKKDLSTLRIVKSLIKEPVSDQDRKLHRLQYTTNLTLCLIFAYDSPLSIDVIARTWSEYYDESNMELEPDHIFLFDKGRIGHYLIEPNGIGGPLMGTHYGSLLKTPNADKFKVTISSVEYGENTFYQFITTLISQLVFYRQIIKSPKFQFSDSKSPPNIVKEIDWKKSIK